MQAILGRPLVPGEISKAILWAVRSVARETFQFTPPGPQDVASWINHMRYVESERNRVITDSAGRKYRRMTPEESQAVRAALRVCVERLDEKPHLQESREQGYRMLVKDEAELPTDEFWTGKEWAPLGKTAFDSDGEPVRFAGYKHASVRRGGEGWVHNIGRVP